ncbi:DUF2975 domain-containing protein [Kordiimonas aquimaris]|uniref:DUF2975 domain-containing protein n=1 Tax=Kordiimonas aquimaris TaxID=707591 RepID=UPI0021CEF867|nr:DUF2975 domain-containing protein [Kordiimonas aquimaris]
MIAQLWYWLFPDTFYYIGLPNTAIEEHGGIASLSSTEWWGSFILTFLPNSAILYALYYLYRLTTFLSAGQWFEEVCEQCCSHISKSLFVYVVLNITHATLLVVLLTMDNPPGKREFAIGFGGDDLMALVLALFALTIAHMVRLARQQRDELNEII